MKNIVESIYGAMREQHDHQVMESVAPAEIKKAIDVLSNLKITLQDLMYFTGLGGYYEEDFDECYEDVLIDNLPVEEVSKDDLRVVWDVCYGLQIEPETWEDYDSEANFNDIAPSGLVKLKKYLDKGDAEDSERYLNRYSSEIMMRNYDEGFFFVGDDGLQILLGVPKRANAQAKKFVIALGNAVIS